MHLIRHGEVHNPDHVVYADLPGFGLSPLGFRQAGEAGARLADVDLEAVYASPLQRAQETAAAITDPHAIEVRIDDRLTEWLMAQGWKGIVWEDLPEQRPGELEQYLADPLDMPFAQESLEQLATRMAQAVDDLAARHVGEIAVVSHQDPIQAARLALTHRTLATQNDDKPDHCEVFTLTPGEPWVEIGRWAPAETSSFPPGS